MNAQNVSFQEWFQSFRPIQNPLAVYASKKNIDAFMFRASGADLEVVKEILRSEPGAIWSVIKNDEAVEVQSGFEVEGVDFYVITEVPLIGEQAVWLLDEEVEFSKGERETLH